MKDCPVSAFIPCDDANLERVELLYPGVLKNQKLPTLSHSPASERSMDGDEKGKEMESKIVKREVKPQVYVTFYYRSFYPPPPTTEKEREEREEELEREKKKKRDIYGFEVPGGEESWELYKEAHEKNWTLSRMKKIEQNFASYWAKKRKITSYCEALVIEKGVPLANRPSLWMIWSGGFEMKQESKVDYYHSILKESLKRRTPSVVQIRKDIVRTFPGHHLYNTEETKGHLHNVLVAFAHRNPGVGYCQSMNFIVGFLLLFLREEEAFWVLCAIVERLLPNFFSPDMFSLKVDLRVLEEIASVQQKGVRHLSKLGGELLGENTLQWFMCLFIGYLPTETCLRVMDAFLLRGRGVLFQVGLGLLKMGEKRILEATDYVGAFGVLKGLPQTGFDGDLLLKVGKEEMRLFPPAKVASLREKIAQEIGQTAKEQLFRSLVHTTSFTEKDVQALYLQFRSAAQLGRMIENGEGEGGEREEGGQGSGVRKTGGGGEEEWGGSEWGALSKEEDHKVGLTYESFAMVMRGMCGAPLVHMMDSLFGVFDEHGTGTLTFGQFVNGFA